MAAVLTFMSTHAAAISAATAVIGTVMTATAMSRKGGIAQAQAQAQAAAAEADARQFEIRAGEELAAGQRGFSEEKKRAAYAISRLQALAAASGGGAAGPTIERLSGGLASEGEARALYQLYAGVQAARGASAQAFNIRLSGQRALLIGNMRARNARFGAYGALFGGAADVLAGAAPTLLEKYG
tara:strand:- start:691 stop:1242 length:552 start_codon:yes stop_codon:yes gene_type:complete